MEKTIRFYAKNVYGNTLFYPVDKAEAIKTLGGTKTITPSVFKGMEQLGFNFVEVLESQVKLERSFA